MGWKEQEKERKEKKAFAKDLVKPFAFENKIFPWVLD
jgi:hypothetical protein